MLATSAISLSAAIGGCQAGPAGQSATLYTTTPTYPTASLVALATARTTTQAVGTPSPASIVAVTPVSSPTSQPTIRPTIAPTPTRAEPIALGGRSRFGAWIGAGDASNAARLKAAGAVWTRVIVSWSAIEPALVEPGKYDFGSVDGRLAAISKAGVSAIVEVRDAPEWASSTRCGPLDKHPERYAAFLSALVSRYKEPPYNIRDYEVYNEPDNTNYVMGVDAGGCFGKEPASYVEALKIAYPAIKKSDSQARVWLGGLAMENVSRPGFNTSFFEQILAAGAADYFDVANVHYYSSFYPNWAQRGIDIAGKVGAFRDVMASHGVDKPVAVTEIGWTSTPKDAPVQLEQQARYVAKVFARGYAADIFAMTWFALSDYQGSDYPYGLYDLAGQPKPALRAFQVASTEFGTADSVKPLDPTKVDSPGGIEGYVFVVGGETRWVLWTHNSGVASEEGGEQAITLPATATKAVDKLGNAIPLATAGATRLQLGESPIFVHFPRG